MISEAHVDCTVFFGNELQKFYIGKIVVCYVTCDATDVRRQEILLEENFKMLAQNANRAGHRSIEIDVQIADEKVIHALNLYSRLVAVKGMNCDKNTGIGGENAGIQPRNTWIGIENAGIGDYIYEYMAKKKFEIDFENYVRNAPPSKREKSSAWSAAIGLQQVDGLTPSKYLFETARRNIEGDITIDDAQKLINSYYESKVSRANDPDDTEEADKVASRIAKILSEKSFNFSPSYLIAIHDELFRGIYKFAGRLRNYDITKKEWVLDGDTVMYGAAFELRMALDYDFEQEREFDYKGLNMDQIVEHLAYFVSRLWQIHAFGEGNTRTTAVFTIKYLRSLGFKVDNKIFADNSWYFRNALVRANYKNVPKGIFKEPIFLENFFRNMLMGEHHEMKNRYLHVNYNKKAGMHSKKVEISSENTVPHSTNVGMEQRLENAKLNAPTKEKLLTIVYGVGGEIFGASKVMELVGCKSTAATTLIKKLLSLEIIEPVTGHGKGKYRVKG